MADSKIGRRIAAKRGELGMSLQGLADAITAAGGHATRASVWEWERNGGISAPNFAALMVALQIPTTEHGEWLAWLLPEEAA
jgi:hypothetical protein